MSNWDDATRKDVEAVRRGLECPHCHAFNQIGQLPTIEVVNEWAVCWCCAKSWEVKVAPARATPEKPSAA